MKKTTQLKQLLTSPDLSFIMEAHNGLSAKIVEETGFQGIWGSGLTLSAAMGVRDNNEASWTQVLEVVEFMSDVTSVPILLDGDTGYGNFNNVRRLIKKLEQRGVSGVCIEDKLFPKTNSFISGETQELADIDEFCGKIKAAKDTQLDPDFTVVARVEAFIAGKGLSEALKRAEAYHQAGADAILMHSKRGDVSEIASFMQEWGNRCPVVIVPTKYYAVPTDVFRDLGISLVIWANHNLRASVLAMQEFSRKLFVSQSLKDLEPTVVKVSEIFRLQGASELEEAEKKYLPFKEGTTSAIILAASQGSFYELTKDKPKALLDVNGETLLDKQLKTLRGAGISDITVVRGFGNSYFTDPDLTYVDNDLYDRSTDLYSLSLALTHASGTTVISYGDILYKEYILRELCEVSSDIVLVVDADVDLSDSQPHDFVQCQSPYIRKQFQHVTQLVQISDQRLDLDVIHGEFIGIMKLSSEGLLQLRSVISEFGSELSTRSLMDALRVLASRMTVSVVYIRGSWLDVDSIVDLQKATHF